MHPSELILHGFICLALLSVWLNSLLTLFCVRRATICSAPGDSPLVSILVPARNEAARIEPCLASLAGQRYPRFEVLLLDDSSTDDTAARAEALGFGAEGKLRVIQGSPLPKGWTGKCWACHQLAEAATGDYLLFTDADTVHSPSMLAAAVHEAQRTRASLLSLWPQQVTHTWAEKAIIPLVYFAAAGLVPHFLIAAAQAVPRLSRLLPKWLLRQNAIANGQFLMFRRTHYFSLGGHAAVRNHLVEDVGLGRLVVNRIADGFRLFNRDGTRLVCCRMYENFSEVWLGFTKNCRAAFEGSLALFLTAGLSQVIIFLLPFVLLFQPGQARWFGVVEVIGIYGIRLLHAIRYRGTIAGALLHPLGLTLALLIALNSWRRSAGAGVEWKGRSYKVTHPASA